VFNIHNEIEGSRRARGNPPKERGETYGFVVLEGRGVHKIAGQEARKKVITHPGTGVKGGKRKVPSGGPGNEGSKFPA